MTRKEPHLRRQLFPIILLCFIAPFASGCAGSQGFNSVFADMHQTGRPFGSAFDTASVTERAPGGLIEASESHENELVCTLQSDQQEELADASDLDDYAMADGQDEITGARSQASYQADTRRGFQMSLKRRSAPGSIDAQEVDEILKTAFRQVGKNYRTGGSTPSGFDCSGFTTWVFSQSGISLPRSSPEQFRYGKTVPKNDLRAGDLVFFKRRKGISHVGIYVDNGTFIHSTSTGGTVKVSSLHDPSWDKFFAGARRIVQ